MICMSEQEISEHAAQHSVNPRSNPKLSNTNLLIIFREVCVFPESYKPLLTYFRISL
jgi:hypothetical protein